jgi:hypothetical protein
MITYHGWPDDIDFAIEDRHYDIYKTEFEDGFKDVWDYTTIRPATT